MEREEVAPGTVLVREGEPDDRFYVLLAGVLAVSQHDLGARSLLRPGDYFGEVAPAMSVPRTATVSAMTPAVVASCDRATFEELAPQREEIGERPAIAVSGRAGEAASEAERPHHCVDEVVGERHLRPLLEETGGELDAGVRVDPAAAGLRERLVAVDGQA